MSQNKKEEVKDFFAQQQSLKSFVKAKADYFGISKVHMSFVSHNGNMDHCEISSSIEAALSFSDALGFTQLVLSGGAKKLCAKSAQEAKASDSKYPAPVWTSQGGSMRNGKMEWRQISLAPSSRKDDMFVLSATRAEGESNSKGGICRKAGEKGQMISVIFSALDLASFARSIEIEIAAYKNALMIGCVPNLRPWAEDADEVVEATAETPKTMKSELRDVFVVYDNKGETFSVAKTPDKAVELLQSAARTLLNTKAKYRNGNKEDGKAVVDAIMHNAEAIPNLILTSAQDPEDLAAIVVRREALQG